MRSYERLKVHYLLEKRLAGELKTAKNPERQALYVEFYNKLFEEIPDHPQLSEPCDLSWQIRLLRPHLKPDMDYLELGPGDCQVSIGVAPYVRSVMAIDASEATAGRAYPANMRKLVSGSTKLPLASESIDLIFSSELMEHLHVEDALEQLEEIYRVLRPGGKYICITPNRINGPHDISRYFDPVATGFHLHEYTYMEIKSIFEKFKVHTLIGHKNIHARVPIDFLIIAESLVSHLPIGLRQNKVFTPLLHIKVVAVK